MIAYVIYFYGDKIVLELIGVYGNHYFAFG